MTSHVTKHYKGCYRVTYPGTGCFGQIKKAGREWIAEIRDSADGSIIRPAGIWGRLRDAVGEVEYIIEEKASVRVGRVGDLLIRLECLPRRAACYFKRSFDGSGELIISNPIGRKGESKYTSEEHVSLPIDECQDDD